MLANVLVILWIIAVAVACSRRLSWQLATVMLALEVIAQRWIKEGRERP